MYILDYTYTCMYVCMQLCMYVCILGECVDLHHVRFRSVRTHFRTGSNMGYLYTYITLHIRDHNSVHTHVYACCVCDLVIGYVSV